MTAPDVVDAHRHLGITAGTDDTTAVLRDMDANGVQTSVVVPADFEIAVENWAGNDRMLAATAAHPGRILAMATVNPWYRTEALAEIRRCAAEGAVGVKLHPALQGFCLFDAVVPPVIEQAGSCGLPVYVHTGTPPHSLPLQLAELARSYPGMTFIMGHAGTTDFKLDALAALGVADNLMVETSWTLPARIGQMVEAVGPERVMFGSDAPHSLLSLELANHLAAPLKQEARESVMALTASKVFGGPA